MIILVFGVAGKSLINYLQSAVAAISLFDEYSHKLEQTVAYGYLLYLIYQVANIIIAYICYKNEGCIEDEQYPYQKLFNRYNYVFQIVGLLFVIPAMININFGRYIRVMTIINLVNLAFYVFTTSKVLYTKKRRLHFLLLMSYISHGVLWVFGESFVNGTYPYILETVFNSL